MNKKIAFVLPGIPLKPSGGAKIVFMYSNLLAKRGYDVIVYFDCRNTLKRRKIPSTIKKLIAVAVVALFPSKIELNRKIRKKAIFSIDDRSIRDADFIVATAWYTAEPISNLSDKKGKKFYLIQGYELWDAPKEYLHHTYSLMQPIVVSCWLKEIVDQYSIIPSTLIPNCIDTSAYRLINPIDKRNPYSVSALYHEKEHKGFSYLWSAIELLKKEYPQLVVRLFGMPKRPRFLPDWVEYTSNANVKQLNEIYNSVSIFMCATINEGFGLTGAEAMACGCALVSTDYLGVHEYATNEDNALLSEIKNVEKMVMNVKRLISDNDYRIRLAERGVARIQKYTPEMAVSLFESTIMPKEGV